jgi:hypothetical protein
LSDFLIQFFLFRHIPEGEVKWVRCFGGKGAVGHKRERRRSDEAHFAENRKPCANVEQESMRKAFKYSIILIVCFVSLKCFRTELRNGLSAQ